MGPLIGIGLPLTRATEGIGVSALDYDYLFL